MMKETLSVIAIAHNEEGVIGRVIDKILAGYRDKILELIIVDDVSTDRTAEIARSRMAREPKVKLVNRKPPCGVGRAVKTGFKNVDPRAAYVLTMDSDFVENMDDIGRMIERMERGDCDGVIGSRFIKGSRMEGYPLTKKIANRLFHYVVRLLFGIKQKDLSNNFKLYKREVIERIPWHSDDFAINAETGILPILAGYKVCEVPASWIGRDEGQGKSKFKLFKVGIGYVKVIPYAWAFRRAGRGQRTG
ncbi:MAG: glycosyltransferase family 2 protein [Candidatus Omnitrophota bacterium]